MIHIIGGAGFLGTRLAKVLGRTQTPYEIFDKVLTESGYVDVTDPVSLAELPTADTLVNLAAEHRDDVLPTSLYQTVNVEGARNICDHCRLKGIRKIIFTSTVAVYGSDRAIATEETIPHPNNYYGKSKLEAESVYQNWLQEDPTHRTLVVVRPTVIFGEGNRGNVYNLLNSIATKRFIMLGNGRNRKSMAYVENVATFLAHSNSFGPGLHIHNYVDHPDLSMNDLVAICRLHLFNKNGVGLRLPASLGLCLGYVCDLIAKCSGRQFSISSLRIKKFITDSRFATIYSDPTYTPAISLETALTATLSHEFSHLGTRDDTANRRSQ